MSDRPNVVLVMTDNQPADAVGCYGNAEIHTPHLDRMAAEGLRFRNAWCPNAMCSPCRASVWTGRMPCQHGVHTWLDDREQPNWPPGWNAVAGFDTLPGLLGRAGYATALIGKYHLGIPAPGRNGIDHWVTMARGHTLSFYGNDMTVNGETFVHEGHSVPFFTDRAVAYIDARAAEPDRPFFLILAYNGPYGHWPAIEGESGIRFAELYADAPMSSVPREGIDRRAVALYDLQKHLGGRGGPDFSSLLRIPNDLPSLRNYYAQTSLIDDGVGRVLEALARNGLDGDTLVVFTADHGFSLGHHGFWGHGQATWPSNVHRVAYNVPLLARAPGVVAAGGVCARHVGTIDLFATILDVAGLFDADAHSGAPSRSFLPLLRDPGGDWEDVAFFEQEETRAVRTPRWLYARRFAGSPAFPLPAELYDLEADPDERNDLAGDPGHAEVERALGERIEDFFARHADPRYDLWNGGAAKSNTSRPWLWRDAWGAGWAPVY